MKNHRLLTTAILTLGVLLLSLLSTVEPASAQDGGAVVCRSIQGQPGVTKVDGTASCEASDGAVAIAIAVNGARAFAHGDGVGTRVTVIATGPGAGADSFNVGPGNVTMVQAHGARSYAIVDITGNDNRVSATATGTESYASVFIETDDTGALSGCEVRARNETLNYSPSQPCPS